MITKGVWRKNLKCLRLKICHLNLYYVVGAICLMIVLQWNNKSDVKPVIIWWTQGFPGTDQTLKMCGNFKCLVTSDRNLRTEEKVAYLFYGSNLEIEDLPLPRNMKIWGLFHEESPRNLPILMHEKGLNIFNYSSTFSRYSDMPFVLQYILNISDITTKRYYVETIEKNKLLADISPILYLQSDCDTMTERDSYVADLMKYINVDSFGKCLNNKNLPDKFRTNYLDNLDEDEFLEFVAKYKFTIAIENGVCDDYITEKLWRAIKVGSVPLYFGSPTVADWLPNNKSAILIKDYDSPEELANYLKMLNEDNELYDNYLNHKLKNKIENKMLLNELKLKPYASDTLRVAEDFECFICKNLHNTNQHSKPSVVNKKHYNCSEPKSVYKKAQHDNSWVYSWGLAGKEAEELHGKIIN